jgi:DNA replicative helicase MCM subunit Mcm2 (Cdc46/Mcm family)
MAFNWVINTNRQTPLSPSATSSYKAALKKLAKEGFDTIQSLLDKPDEAIDIVKKTSKTHNQLLLTLSAVNYELGIGKDAEGKNQLLDENRLKWYNAYQTTKINPDGTPHASQRIFESYKEYLTNR